MIDAKYGNSGDLPTKISSSSGNSIKLINHVAVLTPAIKNKKVSRKNRVSEYWITIADMEIITA